MRRRGGYYYSSYRESAVKKLLQRAYRPAIILIISLLLVHSCFFRSYRVQNDSLAPAIQPGDVLLVQLFGNTVDGGDAVLLYPPYSQPHTPFSRLRSGIRAVQSYFSDTPNLPAYLHTPVIRYTAPAEWDETLPVREPSVVPLPDEFPLGESMIPHPIPDGQIAVYASGGIGFLDSRHYGVVAEERVRGTAVLRIWPLQRWERLRGTKSGN